MQKNKDSKAAQGMTRRALLKKLLVAAAIVPAVKLSETVARAERRRRNRSGKAEEIWIGHC